MIPGRVSWRLDVGYSAASGGKHPSPWLALPSRTSHRRDRRHVRRCFALPHADGSRRLSRGSSPIPADEGRTRTADTRRALVRGWATRRPLRAAVVGLGLYHSGVLGVKQRVFGKRGDARTARVLLVALLIGMGAGLIPAFEYVANDESQVAFPEDSLQAAFLSSAVLIALIGLVGAALRVGIGRSMLAALLGLTCGTLARFSLSPSSVESVPREMSTMAVVALVTALAVLVLIELAGRFIRSQYGSGPSV